MKKVLSIALLIMLVFALATTVKAATPAESLYDYVAKGFTIGGEKVGLKNAELVQVERYLSTLENLTEGDVTYIESLIDASVGIMNNAGVTTPFDLEGTGRLLFKDYAYTVADMLGLKIEYSTADKTVYATDESGEVVLSYKLDGNLPQTDVAHYEYVVIPAVAIIAVAIVAVHKKLTANA